MGITKQEHGLCGVLCRQGLGCGTLKCNTVERDGVGRLCEGELTMNQPDLDIEILLPVSAKGKYWDRFKAFQRTGLLNHRGHKIHVTLLTGTEEPERFERGWDYPITIVPSRYDHVASKIYDYYSTIAEETLDNASWFMRVDDDSCTDVGGLSRWAGANFRHEDCIYLMAASLWDIVTQYREAAIRLGYDHIFRPLMKGKTGNLPSSSFAHEMECSFLSQGAMRRIFAEPNCRRFFQEIAKLESGFGDHGLAVASRMVGIPTSESEVLCCWPAVDKFSLFGGGDFFHIHFIAPDVQGWEQFQAVCQKYL